MKKIIPLLSLVFASLLPSFAWAENTKLFRLNCFVGNDRGEILGTANLVATPGEIYKIFEQDGFTFQASVSSFNAGNVNGYVFALTILKDGKMVSQSVTDVDVAKMGSANLFTGPEFRSLSCTESVEE